MPRVLHDASQWMYMSEGGKNAVFAFIASNESRGPSATLIDSSHDVQTLDNLQQKTSLEYRDYVLRIPKVDLALAAAVFPNDFDSCLTHAQNGQVPTIKNENILFAKVKQPKNVSASKIVLTDKDSNQKAILSNISFQTRKIRPLLGSQYIDAPVLVQYTLYFLAELRHRALQEDRIPISRLSDWSLTDRTVLKKIQEANDAELKYKMCYGALHKNHTLIQNFLPPTVTQKDESSITKMKFYDRPSCISLELKPKAGYVSTSPLVKPAHRHAKYRFCRFEILQRLMELGHVHKEWRNPDISNNKHQKFEKSSYSPMHFFSFNRNQESSLRTSLDALFDRPQINLRLWWNSQNSPVGPKMIFGNEKELSEEESFAILEYIFHFSSSAKVSLKDYKETTRVNDNIPETWRHKIVTYSQILKHNMKQIATEILLQERAIRRNLLVMQKTHDIIDADGAIEVYKRLVKLCAGSDEEAQALVDNEQYWNIDSEKKNEYARNYCIDRSETFPVNPPKCHALSSLLTVTKEFRETLKQKQMKGSGFDIDDKEWMDAFHIQSTKHVRNLCRDACIWLLQNWLCALTMCDVSLFATFHPVTVVPPEILSLQKYKKQTCDYPGWFDIPLFGVDNGDSSSLHDIELPSDSRVYQRTVKFFYTIKVVDCDPKPAAKLTTRAKHEEIISLYEQNPSINKTDI